MKNHLRSTAIAAVLAVVSTSSFAADQGAFFINGNLGQSNFHDQGFSSHTDTGSSVRLGYRWQTDAIAFGVEGGYASLGTASGSVVAGGVTRNYSGKVTGPLLGGNVKYTFRNKMFASARAGWFRSKFEMTTDFAGSQSTSGDGSYIGATLGYDVTHDFSVGVSFDEYHGRAKVFGVKSKESVSTLSGFVEMRF